MVFKRNKKYQEFLKNNFDIETFIFNKDYNITYPTNSRTVLTEKRPSEGTELFEIYVSKVDGSHSDRLNDDYTLRMLFQAGITEKIQNRENIRNNTCNIGFEPFRQKWHGWSHRARFGFGIGSECKLGSSGFRASNREEFLRQTELWHTDSYRENVVSKHHINQKGVITTWTVKQTKEKRSSFDEYPKTFGRGEWTTKTLEDAKQMACDFAQSVS